MTAPQLSSIAALILSLLFGYLPGLQGWYDKLTSQYKALVMGALLVVVAVGSLAYTCDFAAACLQADWKSYLDVLIAALVANVGTYTLLVRPFHNAPGRTA